MYYNFNRKLLAFANRMGDFLCTIRCKTHLAFLQRIFGSMQNEKFDCNLCAFASPIFLQRMVPCILIASILRFKESITNRELQ